MKNGKKRIFKIGTGVLIATVFFGTGVAYAAHAFLNWTGGTAMTNAGIFVDQSTEKLVKTTKEKETLISDKERLEAEVEDLKQQLEEAIQSPGGSQPGWEDKDQQIIDLRNEIISKENEINHLKQQLTAANEAADVIQGKLDTAYERLETNGINIWN